MSLTVAAFEHGKIRVFQLSDGLHNALKSAADLAPLEQALETIFAKSEDVQIIGAAALDDMDLGQFLTMAYGIDGDALANIPDPLGASAAGYAVIRSGAFGEAAVALKASADATLITTLNEGGAEAPRLTPLQSDAALGTLPEKPAKPPKSDARIGGMVATVALLFLFALVGLMIWIAG